MLKFNDFISEAHRGVDNYSISFIYEDQNYEIASSTMRELFCDVVDWLYERGYDFSNLTFSIDEMNNKIKTTTYRLGHFHDISNSGNVIQIHINNPKLPQYLVSRMEQFLTDFGSEDVKFEGFDIYQKSQKLEVENPETDRVIPPTEFIKTPEKPKVYVRNPFGCKEEDGEETSALCILGKSGSGKTTTTEQALDLMGHEYLLYIPIEGEYTFSQYTGEGFEMSSLGEFVMRAQKDPSRCYTVIFDECHRPITISKLNTDLLQALSSRRNRGGERFFTMDRVTKRMYTTPSEEFPIPLKEKSGKILVPDNFGIVCLSSQPAVICRNEDFLNRVDLSVFQKSNRGLTDITLLDKIDKSKIKGTELTSTINALLANEGE
jgi:energy-coupling factor transporter ATP-binding protein EcfA2